MHSGTWTLAAAVSALAGCAALSEPLPARETLLVARSVRTERAATTTWCTRERAGFAADRADPLIEDGLDFHSIDTAADSARIVNASRQRVGAIRTCLAAAGQPGHYEFFIQGSVGGVSIGGTGECTVLRADTPAPGIASVRCTVPLRSLSPPFTGGVLVSNTLSSRALLSGETDPPGYLQASIATIRLWQAP